MSKFYSSLLLLLFLLLLSISAQDSGEGLSVTVYNDNLGIIRDIRPLTLKKGANTIELGSVSQMIDATSVRIKFDGTVLEQNYQYDLVSMVKILERYINKEVTLIGEKEEVITGTLLSVANNQAVIKKSDGGLMLLPALGKYRISVDALPEGLITTPTLKVDLNANKAGRQNLELAYMTGGMKWHAEYVAVLDKEDKKMDLNAWVSIENTSGTSYNNAKLKLVAGDVNLLKSDYNQYNPRVSDGLYMEKSSAPQFTENEFFEYHIYTLQRPSTIANNEVKQISLFEASSIPVVKKYQFISDYYSAAGKKDVSVMVEFENKEEYGLGIPMPKGKVRIYKSDGGSLEFIGEDKTDHTPRNEKISLKMGNAFDLVAEEKMENYKQISDRVHEATFILTLKNRKKESVTINVIKNAGFNWEVKKNNFEYTKRDASSIEFNIPVQPDAEVELRYTIRYSY